MESSPSWFQVISLEEWWEGISSKRLPLIDVRTSEEYQETRLESNAVTIVHLPLTSLLTGERSMELPPRHVEFALLISSRESLEQVRDFFGATKSRATQQSRKPWRVRQVLVATHELWEEALQRSLVQTGPPLTSASIDTFVPLPRLWKPDPMVQHVLLPLLKEIDSNDTNAEVWDLGSGAGRDVCFLAEQLKNTHTSLTIVGIDNHKASSQRCLPFWKHRGVTDETEARLLNLSRLDVVKHELENRDIVCFYAVRYWNRKLVQMLADNSAFVSGTLFAMSHFCKPHADSTWEFDHPKEKHVLERNELQEIFQSGWEILHNDISTDGDHGRTLIQFVARRLK